MNDGIDVSGDCGGGSSSKQYKASDRGETVGPLLGECARTANR